MADEQDSMPCLRRAGHRSPGRWRPASWYALITSSNSAPLRRASGQLLRPVVRTWMPTGWEVRMPGEPPHVAEMESFLAERGEMLLRTAILLTGSRDTGEDLLQAALERLFRNWRKIHGDPEGYLRRILAHLAPDGWRRRGRWRGSLGLLQAADAGYLPDDTSHVDLRDQLVRLLLQLPPRQRTAIVLRYWEELSEAETAGAGPERLPPVPQAPRRRARDCGRRHRRSSGRCGRRFRLRIRQTRHADADDCLCRQPRDPGTRRDASRHHPV